MIRSLTTTETNSQEFLHLLWLATEVGDPELDRVIREELPQLTVLGTIEDNRVLAFIAFRTGEVATVIEYIAVAENAQRSGLGTAMVGAVRGLAPDRAVYAETDDDAVNFYRRTGFTVTAKDRPDSRWPHRQQYECVLN